MPSSTPNPTTLQQTLTEHIRAGFAGIWLQSYEHDEAMIEIARICNGDNHWDLMSWDCHRGLRIGGEQPDGNTDPMPPVAAFFAHVPENGHALLVLHNYHRFIDNAEIVQLLSNFIAHGKTCGLHVVILSCVVDLPVELEKHFVVIEHELPDRSKLGEILDDLPGEFEHDDSVLDAAAGLTAYEAEGSFSLSAIRNGLERISSETVWEIKAGALKKAGTLELHRGNEDFDSLGGLDAMKGFCKRSLITGSTTAKARGVLLLGVPGAGKSHFAKALGNEVGRPTILMDFGSLMGSLVGQTEQRTRQALQIVDRMAPCVLFVDEIEKGLSGASGSFDGDSGVSKRMFGTLLTWLNDHESDVFFVGTCNDIEQLTSVSAGAFTRAERFDGIFFIDLPSEEQRSEIWSMYCDRFQLDHRGVHGSLENVNDTGWTGAEIKSCCRLSALLDCSLAEAATMVVPVSRTSGASIERLRAWADGKALDANRSGIYSRQDVASAAGSAGGATKQRRSIG